jgi:hypothetical protein
MYTPKSKNSEGIRWEYNSSLRWEYNNFVIEVNKSSIHVYGIGNHGMLARISIFFKDVDSWDLTLDPRWKYRTNSIYVVEDNTYF